MVKKTNMVNFPTAEKIFRDANSMMLPKGIEVCEERATVPLQELLNHSTVRYGFLDG